MTTPLADPVDGLTGLSLTGYNARGLVRVAGEVPNGTVTVDRRAATMPTYQLRGGVGIKVTTQGFVLEDSEAPIDTTLTYTATNTVTDRVIQRNMINSPDFSRGVQSWTAGAARTLTTSGTEGRISNNTGGSGLSGQTIAEVGVGTLLPATTYLVMGKIRFSTPNVFNWLDVKGIGTWAQVKAAKATWAAVLSTEPIIGSGIFTQVFVSLASGASAVGATIEAINVPMNLTGNWTTFAVYLTTPSSIPAGTRLRILHGPSVREKAISWELDRFTMQLQSITNHAYKLDWFNGDTITPARPADYLVHNQLWEAVTADADITWEGTVGNSVSRFTGPSKVSTSADITLGAPDISEVCGPVLLSDPVNSGLGMWFGLGEAGDLDYDANLSLMKVINRPDYIASSLARSGPQPSMLLLTKTLDERALALKIFASGRVLYLRNSDISYPENNWYIALSTITEIRTLPDARRPERTWSFNYTRVERPTGMIEASSGVKWSDYKAAGVTWGQLRGREDWLDVLVTSP